MPGACSCHGDGLFGAWSPCVRDDGSVNEPCVQEVSGYDITMVKKKKKKKEKGSTWARLHAASHRAQSLRYATMTHAPFSTRWRNEDGPRTDFEL